MPKISIKTLYLFGLTNLLALNFNLAAVRVGYTFRIDQLANRVSEKLMERKPWYSRFVSKPEPTVNGIGLVFAFEKLGVDEPVSPSVIERYTILDLLYAIDHRICIELVKYKNQKGYTNWNNFSEEDFRQLNDIQKSYLNALLTVLEQKYGAMAKPYTDEIRRNRAEFEHHNNGYLLERI